MDLLPLAICGTVAFIVRAGFPIYAGKWGSLSSDANFQMKLIEEIKANDHKIPYRLNQFLIAGYMAYPYLIYWFFSYWPEKIVNMIRPFFGAVIDAIFAIVIYIFVYTYIITSHPSEDIPRLAFMASLLFATTPFLVRADGRSFSINGRAFGGLVYTLAMIFLFQWQKDGNMGWLLVAIFSGSLIFLSSKFAAQALILINLVLSILTIEYIFLLLPVLSFMLALVLSGGTYLRIFKGHINHLYFYYTTLQYKHLFTLSFRTPLSTFKHALECLRSGDIINFLIELYRIPLIKLLTHLPLLFPCFIFYYQDSGIQYTVLYKWLISSLIVFFIVLIPKFSFIGEAERYLEYTILPITLISAIWLNSISQNIFMKLIWPYFLYCLFLISANYWAAVHFKADSRKSKAENEIIDFLHNYPSYKLNIMTIPTLLGKKIALKTRHHVVEHAGNMATTPKAREEFNFIYPLYYDLPNPDLALLCDKFQLDILVVNHRWLKQNNYYGSYDFSGFKSLYENQEFTIYLVVTNV